MIISSEASILFCIPSGLGNGANADRTLQGIRSSVLRQDEIHSDEEGMSFQIVGLSGEWKLYSRVIILIFDRFHTYA